MRQVGSTTSKLLLLLVVAVLAACTGGGATVETGSAGVENEGTSADDVGQIEELNLQYANPAPEADAQAFRSTVGPWIELVEEATGGQVTFDTAHAGSLLTHADMMEGVGTGLADLGSAQLSIDPSNFPLWSIAGMHDPDIGTRLSSFGQTMVTRLMMKELPELEQSLAENNLMMLFSIASSPHHLITRMEIDGLEDLEGLQIRTYGEFMPALFDAVGATGVNMPSDELYTALDRGVVDGAYTLPAFLRDNSIGEVTSQLTLVGPGTTPPLNAGYHLTVNRDVWDSLSPELKVIMLEAAREVERYYSETVVPADEEEAVNSLEEDFGLRIGELSEEELAEWSDKFPDLWTGFAEDLDGRGLPGSELVDTYLELTELPIEELETRYNAYWDELIEAQG